MHTQSEEKLFIGFDDTDSINGGCTTFLATTIIRQISNRVTFLDYPRLIRNNPNIPWKTRGNGAIALSLLIQNDLKNTIIQECAEIIKEKSMKDIETNPGIVFIEESIPEEIKKFSVKALSEVISIKEAKTLLDSLKIKYEYLGNGRGLVGGLAAIGNILDPIKEDFTFELLSYRKKENVGSKRELKQKSVKEMDNSLAPFVFNNIDEETNKCIINPAGLDPVLYGIRGENPEVLVKAMKMIESEEVDSYCIFRTNQGTDQHFNYTKSNLKNFNVFKDKIRVVEKPKTIVGGHVFFKGEVVKTSKIIDVAAFEPTKGFRKAIRKLIPGDEMFAYGGLKYKEEFDSFTIHLEKCEIISLVDKIKYESPLCPRCNKRMVSAGKNKGYKCRKCKFIGRDMKKIAKKIKRRLEKGIYIPPAQAQRHLVKPYRRYKLPLKTEYKIIEDWYKQF